MLSRLLHSRLTLAELVPAFVFVLFLIAAFKFPRVWDSSFCAIERFASRVARHRTASLLSIALLPLIIRICLLTLVPVPVPGVHDEFSYLLAADTFAKGRLTNPPHPMRIFFETIHVNQLPTYMSKYPPAQGAVLAIGQVLGHPWIGVLLSVSAMCAAIFWMLRGWVPASWAFLGAILVALRIGAFSYWINSYWGGAVPALGGALVMGALPRLRRPYGRVRNAIWLGVGLSLLANSRPLEGALLCTSAAVLLPVIVHCKTSSEWLRFARRIVSLPVVVISVIAVLFMGYYNARLTGNFMLLPYTVNDRAYSAAPHFIWQKSLPIKHSSNPQIEGLYSLERQYWSQNRLDSLKHFRGHLELVLVKFGYFFLWPQFVLPFAISIFYLQDAKIRFFLLQFLLCFLGMVAVVWSQPHYAAPLTASVFMVIIQVLRRVRRWQYRGVPIGLGFSRAIVGFSVAMTVFYVAEAAANPYRASFVAPAGVWGAEGNRYREGLLRQLQSLPGNHLVLVRYLNGNTPSGEWVYNRADIDSAKVVWARDIPGVDLKPLLNYFRDRHVWFLEAGTSPPKLSQDPPM